MKTTPSIGLTYEHRFTVPISKTVAALYPEATEFQAMPAVFATGFMVGLLEWACIKAIHPYLDWPDEQTVGTHINVSHQAPTPPGMTVTVSVVLLEIEGRKLEFSVEAHDGMELIARGTHERFIIQRDRFNAKVSAKLAANQSRLPHG